MITIKRPVAPGFLSVAGNKWEKETNEAIAHYQQLPLNGTFKFVNYGDSQMKAALKEVFKKCAYCESKYASVYDGDIEHFRPKGKVNEKNPQTPGYYWLANTWENLFLSCQHCNQGRRHLLAGEAIARRRGKLDQFPLKDESKRVDSPGSLQEEDQVRLLLNPCLDNPENHFAYEPQSATIIPLTEMGSKSVEIYVLQRPELVNCRYQRFILLFRQIERVKRELDRYNHTSTPDQQATLNQEMNYLLEYTEVDSEYAGMGRFFVRKFLIENNLV